MPQNFQVKVENSLDGERDVWEVVETWSVAVAVTEGVFEHKSNGRLREIRYKVIEWGFKDDFNVEQTVFYD